MDEDKKSFLSEYNKLCKKHMFYLAGCGCCSSPYIDTLKVGTIMRFREGVGMGGGYPEVDFMTQENVEVEKIDYPDILTFG